jgi:hypothetical protein
MSLKEISKTLFENTFFVEMKATPNKKNYATHVKPLYIQESHPITEYLKKNKGKNSTHS